MSFASAEDLWDKLGLTPGSVTPLGLLGREGGQVELFLDQAFLAPPGLIGVHPNDNTATVVLPCEQAAEVVRRHGNSFAYLDLPQA